MAKKTQIQKFRETARALGADESEDRFNTSLKIVGRPKPSPKPKHQAKGSRSKKD